MKNRFCEPLILLCVVSGCGVQDAPMVSAPQPTNRVAGPDEQALGIGNAGSSNFGSLTYAYAGPSIVREGQEQSLNSYVRFKRPNGVECSGVLAHEPTSANSTASGAVDVYLYTALHCFEESDPFGNPKTVNTTISNGYRYDQATATGLSTSSGSTGVVANAGNVGIPPQSPEIKTTVTTPLKYTPKSDPRAMHVMYNNGKKSDVVRIWQGRIAASSAASRVLPICSSKPSEGSRVQVFGFGTDLDHKYNYSVSSTSLSGAVVSFGVQAQAGRADFAFKQIGMAMGQYQTEPSRSLSERLGALFTNPEQLNISPYIMRIGGTSSQPGESGSPVFSVQMKMPSPSCPAGKTFCTQQEQVFKPLSEEELVQAENIAGWNCVAGLLSREVAQRSGNSNTLEWDTFFSPFMDVSERSWKGFSHADTTIPADLISANSDPFGKVTFNGSLNALPVGSGQTLTTCFGTLCPSSGSTGTQATSSVATANSTVPVVKTVSSRTLNLNAETLFGSSVFKSTTPKEIIISENVVVTSSSTSSPALLIPAGGGGVIKITNKGKIIGKGGSSGVNGGDAMVVRSPATLTNTGLIAGGGGGGGVGGQGGLGGQGGMGVTTRGVKVAGGNGGAGGLGGAGGKGADETAAVDGSTGRSGSAGRSASGAGSGGTGGTGGKGGLGGALGENGSAGQSGGAGGQGGNGNFSKGAAGRSGSAGSAGGVAGFAINGSSLLEGRFKIGGACADVSSSYGELKGRRNALMSSGDSAAYVCN